MGKIALLLLIVLLFAGCFSTYPKDMHVHAIGWNGREWLVGGIALDDFKTFLVKWDEKRFSDITPSDFKDIWIRNIFWDRERWKLYGSYTGSEEVIIFSFDGGKMIEMERRDEEPKKEIYEECNKDYCLIWNNAEGKLFKYDSKKQIDITVESGVQYPFESVDIMVWNGKYWLIGAGGIEAGIVVKYDGESFTRLEMPERSSPCSIAWNGKYWLIGTCEGPQFRGILVKYDGNKIKDLTPELKRTLLKELVKEKVKIGIKEGHILKYGIFACALILIYLLYVSSIKKDKP